VRDIAERKTEHSSVPAKATDSGIAVVAVVVVVVDEVVVVVVDVVVAGAVAVVGDVRAVVVDRDAGKVRSMLAGAWHTWTPDAAAERTAQVHRWQATFPSQETADPKCGPTTTS